MFLHIGGDMVVLQEDIITIIDSKTGMTAPATKKYLENARFEGIFRSVGNEKVKSYVVTSREIFLSPISAFTLLKRSKASQKP